MLESRFVEDVLEEFYNLIQYRKISVDGQEFSAVQSFYDNICRGVAFTQNQANFLLKILHKYKTFARMAGLDLSNVLANPQWKNPFRVLDLSKKIYVEKDDIGTISVCLKFPFQLKKEFETEFPDLSNKFSWDAENKIRRHTVYDVNMIQLYEFVKKHNFDIDDSFMIILGEIEEIWQNQDQLLPRSKIDNSSVVLVNTSEDAANYWRDNSTGKINNDLFLAKSMGFILDKKPENLIERICSEDATNFWIEDMNRLLSLSISIEGRTCIILDQSSDSLEWLKDFAKTVDNLGIDRSLIKVCFRSDKEENPELNSWVKNNGFGGKIDSGKILIFHGKPAKWLFKDLQSVKIIATTIIYPSLNPITRDFINSSSCVFYLGNLKPSEQRGHKIVKL